MNSLITYRWLNMWEPAPNGPTPAELSRIDETIASHGWPQLNLNMTRLLLAVQYDGPQDMTGTIIGFSVLQMIPYAGPLHVEKSHRGAGVSEALADQTLDFLRESNARGWLVIADSPHTASLCEDRGMKAIESPVYVSNGKER